MFSKLFGKVQAEPETAGDIVGVALERALEYFADIPEDSEIQTNEEGTACCLPGEGIYMILCNLALPLRDTQSIATCGLWVEVDETTFLLFLERDSHPAYASLRAEGRMLCDWPAVGPLLGSKATIEVLDAGQKPYITAIETSHRDIRACLDKTDYTAEDKTKLRKRYTYHLGL